MKNMKIVEDVILVMVFITVDATVLIYGKLEKSNREYSNVITIKERIRVPWVSCAALRYELLKY